MTTSVDLKDVKAVDGADGSNRPWRTMPACQSWWLKDMKLLRSRRTSDWYSRSSRTPASMSCTHAAGTRGARRVASEFIEGEPSRMTAAEKEFAHGSWSDGDQAIVPDTLRPMT